MNPKQPAQSKTDWNSFRDVRQYTESLCRPLQPEDMVPQPVSFVSPAKWHLAHTTWFFEEFLLRPNLAGYKCFCEDFSYLFNSYYNTVGKRVLKADRGNITRPGVDEVYEYRKHVDAAVEQLLSHSDLDSEVLALLELGLNHEQQHQELLLTDIKYILGHNPIFPVYQDGCSLVTQQNSHPGWIQIDEGVYEVGFAGDGFHYDNELGRHKVYIHETQLNKSLVTVGEFLEFMNDGGYGNHNLWLDEGWAWVNKSTTNAPLYWHQVDGEWWHYTLSGFKPVDEQHILGHVNYYEAWAFAEWKGMRLPTEFEWEIASDRIGWGQRWEWTGSAYLPYPGFAKAEGAIGEYNGKFMINTMVLRGGSSATAPNHSRPTYRNFFHPKTQWQCTGIRLAKR
jgi:ergothioneine biosynthesis protein EgtB